VEAVEDAIALSADQPKADTASGVVRRPQSASQGSRATAVKTALVAVVGAASGEIDFEVD
jgi:hypothetical protein